MQPSEQIALYALREKQHCEWAARTSVLDHRQFHTRLAEHYGQLGADLAPKGITR